MARTVGKIEYDGEWIVLFDGVAPLHVDLITELADEDGIVRISFAAVTQDGDGTLQAHIVSRVRMKQDVAWGLCRSLKELQG